MMMDVAELILVALVVGFALHKSDDSNFQVAVVPVAVGLLLWLFPEGQRGFGGAGIALGALAYIAVFLFQRMRRAPMPSYQASGVALATAAGSVRTGSAPGGALSRTPAGPDGPYYMPNTPQRRQIAAKGTSGERMNFAGQVLRQDSTPVAGACIEIWHADGNGDYDHHTFNTRGHQFTDDNGEFLFETTKPSGYGTHSMSLIGTIDFRSAHIHVKIRTGDNTFTTQVWFPDDPRNATDIAYWAFKNSNVVSYEDDGPTRTARFNFVV